MCIQYKLVYCYYSRLKKNDSLYINWCGYDAHNKFFING